jgi:hypothetical protein
MLQDRIAIGRALYRWVGNAGLFSVDSPVDRGEAVLGRLISFVPVRTYGRTYNQMYVGRGASREVHLLPVTDRPGSDHRGLTRLIRGVISRGMIPHDRAASTDPSATSDHPERKHRRHRRPNKWSNRESGGSSRDARANHRDPHRTRHVVPIGLSFFFPFVIAASSICKYNFWRHEAV